MIKSLLIILSILHMSTALAVNKAPNTSKAPDTANINKSVVDIIDPPNSAALNIMVDALSSLKELKKQNKATPENIEALIRIKLLPNIAIGVSTKITLSKHWNNLNIGQKEFFQYYIAESLIQDYVGILSSYDKLNTVKIAVDPKVKRKDNKAIVKLIININDDPKPIMVSLKMIRLNSWYIYDLVFSGVSIVKNYSAQFNSHIKRKGVESLIKKSEKKLKKLKNYKK